MSSSMWLTNSLARRLATFTFLLAICLSGPLVAADGKGMARVLAAISQKDYPLARREAAGMRNAIAVDIVTWHQLRAGGGRWTEYTDFLGRNFDWPGLSLMHKRAEIAMPSNLPREQVIRFYRSAGKPQTGRGAFLLATAQGGEAGRKTAADAWVNLALGSSELKNFLSSYGKALKPYHVARLDEMIWRGNTKQAEAMLTLVSKDDAALARARIALRRNQDGVDALIKAVPKAKANDPGLAYERFAWRMRKDRYDDSEVLIKARSKSAESLGRPEVWSNRRRILARRAMRQGRVRVAYNLASQHFLSSGSDYADLEWLSGYIALTHLRDFNRAIRHFERFRLSVKTPISLGRAGYWTGRAYEAAGNKSAARSAYGFGAAYQTSFYGQLATERAGLPKDTSMAKPRALPDWRQRSFANSSPIRAALLLREAGDHLLMLRFILHVQESLDLQDTAALARMALDIERPFVAVKIAKRAARQGAILPQAYYPVAATTRAKLPVPKELANAIARQESELNAFAISPAGAHGLMQLMPATAKKVAGDIGIEYNKARLTQDPAYNTRLGSQYLAEMLARYDGSIILAAVAYNAGPHRADRWIASYGDPRSPDVDPIWWIENIQYRETRNYVMRVMESLYVYRTRISGKAQPIGLHKALGLRN